MKKIAIVVDDSRIVRMALGKLLTLRNFEVVEFDSSEEALLHLQSNTNNKPDIIFMDVMMHGMDGLEATQKIKADSSLSMIPIVMCTGNEGEKSRDEALAIGAMAVLSKPPEIDALEKIIAKLERQIPAEPQAKSIAPAPTPTPRSAADESVMVEKIIKRVEQTLVPRVQVNVREMAEDISRQIAVDTAEQVASEQVKSQVESMLPSLKEQLLDQTKQEIEELVKQTARRAAREAVAKSAEQSVQRAITDVDISGKVLQTLSSEATMWLKHQEQQLQTKLDEHLKENMTSSIDQHLNDKVPSIVANRVTVELAKQGDFSVLIVEQMGKRLRLLKSVVTLLVLAVGFLGMKVLM